MKKKCIIASVLLVIVIIGLLIYKFLYPTLTDVYRLDGDFIPSVKTAIGHIRYVSNYEVYEKDNILFKTYTYKNVDDVIGDLKTYTNYLREMEQFQVVKEYDLNDFNNTSIYLAKKSHMDENYILQVTIDYTSSSYTILLERKKGQFLE